MSKAKKRKSHKQPEPKRLTVDQAIRIATAICEEKLEASGFTPNWNITEPKVNSEGDVSFVVHLGITTLDIELAQREPKQKCPYDSHADDCDCEGAGGDR